MDAKIRELILKDADHRYEQHYSLKNGDIYIEAGVAIGRYSKFAGNKVGKNGKVIMIEPSPYNVRILKDAISENIIKNATLLNKAVSSKNKKMAFADCINDHNSSRLSPELSLNSHVYGIDIVEVDVDTIDNIINDLKIDKVDLLAADVENAEVELIKGAKNSLEKGIIRNVAICTYHDPGNHNIIAKMLKDYGFVDITLDAGVTYGRNGNIYFDD